MKKLWPSIKFGLVLMGTQFIMSLFSLVLGAVGDNVNIVLRIVLGVLFLVGVLVMIYAYTRNTAYTEFNRRQNNRVREKNGEPVTPDMRGREYVWYKGYAVGACISLPLIVIAVVTLATGSAVGLASLALYGCYLFPIYLAVPVYQVALQFVAVPIMILLPGITYHVQGIRMERGLLSKIDSRVKR